MLRLLIAFSYALTTSFGLWGQTDSISLLNQKDFLGYSINGVIKDDVSTKPLEFATISVFQKGDSTLISGALTDEKGAFEIRLETLEVYLKIEFIGYEPLTIDSLELLKDKGKIDLGEINLAPNISVLNQVEVRAEKSSLMMTLDRKVFNVGKDLLSTGGTAEDILRNVPGVWVDMDGKVTLRSIGEVRILLDGQPNLFVGQSNSNGLRQIPANQIDRIEIISNPSARFEAEGLAGIINIVLKKNRKKGLNGSTNANLGLPENFGLGVNLNYQNRKFNIFGSLNGWYVKKKGNASYRNRFFSESRADSVYFSNLDRTHTNNVQPFGLRIGSDYFLNKKNTITGALSIRNGKSFSTANLVYTDSYRSPSNIYLVTKREEKENGTDINLNGYLRHKITFKNKEQSLTTDISFESDNDANQANYSESYYDGDLAPKDSSDFYQIAKNNAQYNQFVIKSDFIYPLRKNSNIETGFQSSLRRIGDDYEVTEVVRNIVKQDSNFTNDFDYNESINAFYVDFGKKMKEFSFQIGLRAEYSHVKSDLGRESLSKINNYLDLFPSAFIGYDFKSNNGVQISYSRRIVRPTFLDLTPFFTIRDRRNVWRGNPDIRPEYIHAFELGYINYWEKGTLSVTGYFHRTKNVIKRIQRVDPRFPGSTVTQAENLDIKRNLGLETVYTIDLVKWLKINGDINLFHTYSSGYFDNQGEKIAVGGQSFSLTTKAIFRIQFLEIFNTQTTFFYQAPRATTQGVNFETKSMDFAVSLDVFKDNGTFTFSINDIFNSRRRRSFSEGDTFYSEDSFLWQTRTFLLSFNYRINQDKNKSQIYTSPIDLDDEELY